MVLEEKIPAIKILQCQNCLQFMCCKNCAKGGAGLICAISSIKFEHLPINEYVLVQGVVDCGGIPIVMYHKQIGPARN